MNLRPYERFTLTLAVIALCALAVYMRSVSQSLAVIASPAPKAYAVPTAKHTPACAADCPLSHCILDEDECKEALCH